MIKIAIVDDEINQIQKIQQIVSDFFEDKKIQININTFTSGEALLSDSNSYNLIFLDIQMNGGYVSRIKMQCYYILLHLKTTLRKA